MKNTNPTQFLYWVTIDPGISGTGIAYWKHDKLEAATSLYPDSDDRLTEHKERTILHKLSYIRNCHPDKLYIEKPTFWPSTKRGQVAAQSKSFEKLVHFVGMLCNEFPNHEMVDIIAWKGQLDKDKVKHRIKKIYPDLSITSHAIDAVGIGLYLLGKFP